MMGVRQKNSKPQNSVRLYVRLLTRLAPSIEAEIPEGIGQSSLGHKPTRVGVSSALKMRNAKGCTQRLTCG